MGWLSGPKSAANALAVPSGTQGVMVVDAFGVGAGGNRGGTVEPDGSFGNYATNAYGRNELVYACIRYRAEAFSQTAIRVYTMGNSPPIDDHRLRQVFEKPNDITSEFELFELCCTYKDIAGTCFWLCVKGRDGLISQIWPLRPDLVGVLPVTFAPGYVWAYRPDPNRPDLTVYIPDAGSPAAAKSETFIIRIRYPNPNPSDPGWRYFGQPPLRAGARAVSLDNAATDFTDSLLRNHAMPSVIIESEAEVTDIIHRRLTSFWVNAFGGPRKGRPAFLQKGMKVHTLGLSPEALEFPDLRDQSETRICSALGVEPILVGAKIGLEHNAYKDYREARLSFWEEAMTTEQRRYIDPVRAYLLPPFNGVGRRRVRAAWDNSEVLALKEAEAARWQRATDALARGGITRNDFRQIIGLPAVSGGDVFLTPAGVVPQEIGEPVPKPETVAKMSIPLLAAEYGIELAEQEIEQLALAGVWRTDGHE